MVYMVWYEGLTAVSAFKGVIMAPLVRLKPGGKEEAWTTVCRAVVGVPFISPELYSQRQNQDFVI